jgi:amino acid transporter
MYLRFGWVVGNVGLIGTLIIVTLATSITFLTSLSIASIATNAPVKAGGAYFMISRSLGIEMGGAVGIPLFLAQAFSVALYIMGFSESMVAIFPSLNIKLVGVVTTILLSLLSMFSTKAAIRAQFVILAIIAFSLVSFFFGSPIEDSYIELWGVPAAQSENFWTVFAVFFPAVTGIMAGVNMSGDLKDPAKSIPKGTFLAVGVGYVIYMVVPFFFAFRADAITLVSDNMIMQKIAFWGFAILLGIWGATLSSAVGSLLGAPRVLQALTIDKVLPSKLSFLAKSSGKEQIPRAATIFTSIIALILVLVGDLNMIAPILTMFFLTTYGTLNLTSGIETLLESPSFRPKFRVHWVFSLLGTVGCFAVMFLINAIATIVAIIFISGIYVWLRRRRLKTTFGDVSRGMLLQIARYALLRLDAKVADAKSWRPNILVFSGMPTKRWHLIDFAYGIVQEKGLITVATILPEKGVTQERVVNYEHNILTYLKDKNIKTLVRVTRAEDPFLGSKQLVNSYGLGSVVPNTILLGDTEENSHHESYCDMISHFYQLKRNVIILQNDFKLDYVGHKQIDLWWGGLKGNGGLMMIIAHLIKTSPRWREINVCVKMVLPNEESAKGARENLRKIIDEMRISFQYKVIVSNNRSFWDIFAEESKDSTMVMMGLKTPDENFSDYYKKFKENTKAIKNKIFFLAAELIEFEDVLN